MVTDLIGRYCYMDGSKCIIRAVEFFYNSELPSLTIAVERICDGVLICCRQHDIILEMVKSDS